MPEQRSIRSLYRLYIRAKLREYCNHRRIFTAQQAINLVHSDGHYCIHEASGLFAHHYTPDYCFHKFLEARACRFVYRRALRKGHGIPTEQAIRNHMIERRLLESVGLR